MSKAGDRVGAVSHSDGDTVYFYGYGEYVGDEIPPKEIEGFNIGIPNPKIVLDDGGIVFGCMCWWGSEEKMKNMLSEYKHVETKAAPLNNNPTNDGE